MTNFKEYFYLVIPETLYSDDPVIKDILDIFLEYIEEVVTPAYNLDSIFNMTNKNINEEILKTYLTDLYEIFNEARKNKIITKELQLVMDGMGLEYNAYASVADLVNTLDYEHIKSAKDYKQKKGTQFAIEYVYNIIKNSGLQPFGIQKNLNDFIFELDNQEYHFNKIEGSLIYKIYHNIVAKATHPVGFTYNYEMKTLLDLIDYFGYDITYINKYVYIQCTTGSVFPFNNRLINSVSVEEDIGYAKIVFAELDYIVKTSTSLIYYNANDTINTNFTGCTLYYSYDISLTSTTSDDIDFIDEDNICNWFDVNSSDKSLAGQLYNYFIDTNEIKGVIGLAPFVICELTSFRQHNSNAVSLYASSPELFDWYYNNPYEINIVGRCDEDIECDGYGIVCGYGNYNTEVCNQQLAFDGVPHHVAIDHIEIDLIAD